MSNVATLFGSLSFVNAASAQGAQASISAGFSVAGEHFTQNIFSVPTTAGGTPIPLGGVASPGGFFFIKNTDPTNYVKILNAASGTVLLRIGPGEFVMGRFDDAVTAPAAIAVTAICLIQYTILDK